jgi:hypothetical protein
VWLPPPTSRPSYRCGWDPLWLRGLAQARLAQAVLPLIALVLLQRAVVIDPERSPLRAAMLSTPKGLIWRLITDPLIERRMVAAAQA